jgi:surface antigen
MAFTPILTDQTISYVADRQQYYTNVSRQAQWGSAQNPVYYVPVNHPYGQYGGYGGPRYQEGYNYNNSPNTSINGNCTWWCWGRLYETTGTYLVTMGDAKFWYDRYTGNKDPDATNINPGDVIVLTDSDAGHVMFVESVAGNTIYISQSAYSTRSVWNGMSCLTASYQKSEITRGSLVDMYRGHGAAYYEEVVGVIHTGPTPGPTPSENLDITISPSSYNVTMTSAQDYVDFTFNITITGIPAGASVSGGNTFPGLTRVSNGSGWVYTNYTVDGTTYQRAVKTGMVLRYTREHDYAYTTTKHMYFNLSFSTGTVSTDTPMRINVQMKTSIRNLLLIAARRRRKGGIINVGKA